MKSRLCSMVLFSIVNGSATLMLAQDTRHVTEPTFPKTCAVYRAPLRSSSEGPTVGPSATEQNSESGAEAAALVEKLKSCPAGQAVELALGEDNSLNSFLLDPISIPPGVSLIIDGGVTVYASRDPALYQDTSPKTNPGGKIVCGTVGQYPPVRGCISFLTFASNSGLYGYGVIDGQGNRTLLTGVNAGKKTWWDLTTDKHGTNDEQASPKVIGAGTLTESADNFVIYKITIRNPPYHTVVLRGNGITVWGAKVQAPWNLPNTDGFDTTGSNITFYDTTVANGDQEIVLNIRATNITVDHFRGYSKGGITILGNGDPDNPVKDVLVQNAIITGDIPSLVGTTVNGVSEATLMEKYGLQSYTQALPNATNDLKALQITTNLDQTSQSKPEAVVRNVTYKSVCIQDIVKPIVLVPIIPFNTDQNLPTVEGIHFQDVHVLAPTHQFPAMQRGLPVSQPAPGTYPYLVSLEADPPGYINTVTFDNVVFDDLVSGGSSVAEIMAKGNRVATETNVYPSFFNELDSKTKTVGNSKLILDSNSYSTATSISSPSEAYPCSLDRLPFATGELYTSIGDAGAAGDSTNLHAVDIAEGGSVTLNAVVQPIMSQTTLFIKKSYSSSPGLVALGSPELTNSIRFYEGSELVGTARLSANKTLATLVLSDIKEGTHTYTAQYPADAYYGTLNFGSVTVQAQHKPNPVCRDNPAAKPPYLCSSQR
jgi:polygalacturonase